MYINSWMYKPQKVILAYSICKILNIKYFSVFLASKNVLSVGGLLQLLKKLSQDV